MIFQIISERDHLKNGFNLVHTITQYYFIEIPNELIREENVRS